MEHRSHLYGVMGEFTTPEELIEAARNLGASLSAVLGMLALNGLPQPHHPVFNVHRFSHASTDRFFICIEARDKKFHPPETARFLQGLKAHHVSEVSDD